MTNINNKENKALSALLDEIKISKEKDNVDIEIISLLDKIENRIKYDKKTVSALLVLCLSFFSVSIFTMIISHNSDTKAILLQNDVIEKSHIINRLERSDSLFNLYMNVDSIGSFSYRIKNGKKYTYNDLLRENDSLSSLLWKNDRKLKVAYDNYGILFTQSEYNKDGKKLMTTNAYSSKIDSALILLDMFGERLKYDKDTDSWYVDSRK